MNKTFKELVSNAEACGQLTLNNLRDILNNEISSQKALEVLFEIEPAIKKYSKQERIAGALMFIMSEII